MITEGDTVRVLEGGPYNDYTGEVTRVRSATMVEVTFPSIFPETRLFPKDEIEVIDEESHIERW